MNLHAVAIAKIHDRILEAVMDEHRLHVAKHQAAIMVLCADREKILDIADTGTRKDPRRNRMQWLNSIDRYGAALRLQDRSPGFCDPHKVGNERRNEQPIHEWAPADHSVRPTHKPIKQRHLDGEETVEQRGSHDQLTASQLVPGRQSAPCEPTRDIDSNQSTPE
jgi:predicted RNA binding protein YcfA (HicA-like mRNA interferase family)